MNGVEEYNNEFDRYAKQRLKDNSDKPFLKGFYYFLLSDGERSYDGSYNYLNSVISFVNEMEITDPEKITFDDYTEYLAKAYRGKSSSYQISIYSALKSFSRYLRAKGLCDDYMSFIKRPKFIETDETKQKRENGYMEEEEITKFLDAIKNGNKKPCWKARDYAMATVLLNSGIRCAALQKLDLKDVNFKNNTISVFEKGGKARIIYLSDPIMENIKEWLNHRSQMVGKDETALFISNHNRRMDRKTIYNTIKEYGSVIEGKHITTHKTRATYGTQLYKVTGDLFFVQERMGHENPKTTGLYIRGQKDDGAKRAADLMAGFII